MVVMLALQKVDLEKLGLRQHCEAAFFGVQVGCYFALTVIQKKMAESPDDPAAPKVKIPAEVVMGNETKPAREMTVKQYDLEQFSQFRTQQLMGSVIMGLVYYKWQSLMPLVLQLLLTPINLYEHQLFQIYVMNQEIQRPFPKPNPFGMPEPAAAPALTADGSQTSSEEFAFTTAEFGKEHDVAGSVCRADPLQADVELVNKSEMKGKVAVVARGLVPFVDKARRAMEAGAVGIIVINDEDSLYKCTAAGADCTDIEIPVICVR